MKKLIILSLSFAYCIYLVSILAADLYSQHTSSITPRPSSIELNYINLSIHLNPLNSEYYYQKYLLSKTGTVPAVGAPDTKPRGLSLNYLQSAIELEPTRAAYHMFYALALLKLTPIVHRPSSITHQAVILQELHRAVTLKPFSKLYQKILNDYLPSLQSHP